MLLYIIMAEVLANFIIADTRVKEIEIGNQEIKIVNFADDTTIFLRDIDSLIGIQFWNYMKKHLTQRWTFLKVKPCGQVVIKKDRINLKKWNGQTFLSKYFVSI